jgi:hypothetical protein
MPDSRCGREGTRSLYKRYLECRFRFAHCDHDSSAGGKTMQPGASCITSIQRGEHGGVAGPIPAMMERCATSRRICNCGTLGILILCKVMWYMMSMNFDHIPGWPIKLDSHQREACAISHQISRHSRLDTEKWLGHVPLISGRCFSGWPAVLLCKPLSFPSCDFEFIHRLQITRTAPET